MTVVDLAIAFLLFLLNPLTLLLNVASTLMILEFGALLILGGCLMAREPLQEDRKIDSDGSPTASWKAALLGRKMLLTALFILMLGALVVLVETTI